ncbi:MAG: YhfC family intramembrane metalloprotease [Clostridia bacterium]|nr:YhfC family intramembrane metalloprotease [Clostridia bacterium]NCC68864.1 YhfC family intramembrane metalloprotease [Clostridia bacterium]
MDYTLLAICISASMLVSVLLPVILLIVWHRKTGARLIPALVGAIIFPVFALGLEQLLHSVVLKQPAIYMNTFLYVVYGCLASGLFEETGRLVAFRFLLRKHRGKETSVTYGIGHGGIEAILTSGISMAVSLVAVITLSKGGSQALEALFGQATAQTLAATLAGNSPPLFLFSGFERAIAILLHISLSVFVFKAVAEKKPFYYVTAILLHASVNCFAALYQVGVLKSVMLVEIFVLLSTLCIAYFAFRIYRSLPRADRDAENGQDMDFVP